MSISNVEDVHDLHVGDKILLEVADVDFHNDGTKQYRFAGNDSTLPMLYKAQDIEPFIQKVWRSE